MRTAPAESAPRASRLFPWLVALAAIVLSKDMPTTFGGLVQVVFRLAFQLAIVGMVLGHVARFLPFWS